MAALAAADIASARGESSVIDTKAGLAGRTGQDHAASTGKRPSAIGQRRIEPESSRIWACLSIRTKPLPGSASEGHSQSPAHLASADLGSATKALYLAVDYSQARNAWCPWKAC